MTEDQQNAMPLRPTFAYIFDVQSKKLERQVVETAEEFAAFGGSVGRLVFTVYAGDEVDLYAVRGLPETYSGPVPLKASVETGGTLVVRSSEGAVIKQYSPSGWRSLEPLIFGEMTS